VGVKSCDTIHKIKTGGDVQCGDLGPRVMWSLVHFLLSRDIRPIVIIKSRCSDIEFKDQIPRVMCGV